MIEARMIGSVTMATAPTQFCPLVPSVTLVLATLPLWDPGWGTPPHSLESVLCGGGAVPRLVECFPGVWKLGWTVQHCIDQGRGKHQQSQLRKGRGQRGRRSRSSPAAWRVLGQAGLRETLPPQKQSSHSNHGCISRKESQRG